MSGGYNVTFDSLFTGSLCGVWPDIGVWALLVAMKDKNGHVDVTPQYIHNVTGIPMPDLLACIERFTSPDPASRTRDDDGRRMRLIDPDRPWGWVIINHQVYKERARLMAKNQKDVETGANAARMSDRRRPPETAGDPLSDSDSDTNSNTETVPEGAPRRTHGDEGNGQGQKRGKAKASKRCPADFVVSDADRDWAGKECPGIDVDRETAKFRNHTFRTARSDWPATWRNWLLRAADDRPGGARAAAPHKTKFDQVMEGIGRGR